MLPIDLASFPWLQGGAGALVTLAVVMLFRGLLWPRSGVEKLTSLYDQRIQEVKEEAKEWKAAWQTSQENLALLAKQNSDLLEQGRTTEQVLRALQAASTQKEITG